MKRESYKRVATYIIVEACQNSENGKYVVDFEDIEKFFGIKLTEMLYFKIWSTLHEVFPQIVYEIKEDTFEDRIFEITINKDFVLDYDERSWGNPNDDEDDETYFDAEEYEEKKPDYSKMTLTEVIEKEGWSVNTNEEGKIVFVENHSPLGEDLPIETCDDTDNIYEAIKREWEAFDVDEHVAMYVDMRGTRGVPNSIEDLVNDANDIEEMLESLFASVNNWYRENKEE